MEEKKLNKENSEDSNTQNSYKQVINIEMLYNKEASVMKYDMQTKHIEFVKNK